MKNKLELLAPAGKWESLVAAVQNGADAVYLGEQSFSARKNAANFTWEEIRNAVRYCHIRGVRVFLALNTLVAEDELPLFEKAVVKAAECGVDALIIQDLGAAKIAKTVCPDMPIHASTQLTASNVYDVKDFQNRGFSRVVLSRELSEEEINHIYTETDAKIETFAHGALCISFSGKCLMSSFIGGRSGNRGMCAQPCRQMYSCGKNKGYLLSPRDLCLADDLEKMADAGVRSFKIEGRMKSPEYVATVTGIYRKYLDSFDNLSTEDEDKLKKIFVRGDGFTKAYFAGQNTPEMMNYTLSNDNISSRADDAVLKEARNTFRNGVENKKIPVNASLKLQYGSPSVLTLSDGEFTAEVFGAEGETAQNTPLSEDRAHTQIGKMGQTPFELRDFEFSADENITLPVSELNRLRRECAELLQNKRGEVVSRETFSFEYPIEKNKQKTTPYLAVEVLTKEQFLAVKNADRVLVPLSLWQEITPDKRCYVVLPKVVLDEKFVEKQLSEIPAQYGVYASTSGMISLAKKLGRRVCADWSNNIYNSVSASCFESCDTLTLSPELSLSSVREIVRKTDTPCEILCHGYQTVMTSRACLIRGITGKCDCTKPISIKDKTGAEFTIIGDKDTHLNTVLNSRITFMADKLNEVRKSGVAGIRLVFTTQSGEEAENTVKMYKEKTDIVKPSSFTRGCLLK